MPNFSHKLIQSSNQPASFSQRSPQVNLYAIIKLHRQRSDPRARRHFLKILKSLSNSKTTSISQPKKVKNQIEI